jgi:hypothetical protein
VARFSPGIVKGKEPGEARREGDKGQTSNREDKVFREKNVERMVL